MVADHDLRAQPDLSPAARLFRAAFTDDKLAMGGFFSRRLMILDLTLRGSKYF